MRDKFRNKNGDLTHYALACGYLQQFKHKELILSLWNEGGPCFHVKLNDNFGHNRVFWHSFDTLTAARKYWHQTKKNLLELSKCNTK